MKQALCIESLSCDGQQFHQYQQNEQWTHKMTMTDRVGNAVVGLDS